MIYLYTKIFQLVWRYWILFECYFRRNLWLTALLVEERFTFIYLYILYLPLPPPPFPPHTYPDPHKTFILTHKSRMNKYFVKFCWSCLDYWVTEFWRVFQRKEAWWTKYRMPYFQTIAHRQIFENIQVKKIQ